MIRALARAREGGVAVEAALVLPILVLLLLGALDVGWWILARQRVDRAAASLADLVARMRTLSEEDVRNAFAALPNLARPFDLRREGRALVSGVRLDERGNATVIWQRASPWGIPVSSRLREENGRADLEGAALEAEESVIVAEVFLRVRPLVGLVIRGEPELYVRWIAAPRYGALAEPSS